MRQESGRCPHALAICEAGTGHERSLGVAAVVHSLNLVQGDRIIAPVVEPRGAFALVSGELRSLAAAAAVLAEIRDAGGTETVVARGGGEARRLGAALHHPQRVVLRE